MLACVLLIVSRTKYPTLATAAMARQRSMSPATVSLDDADGNNNGTVGGHTYFVCEEGHGVLVPSKKVKMEIRVDVEGYGKGSLVFLGEHAEMGSMRAGVWLDDAVGKNDGTVGGHEYFRCPRKHGVLVPPKKVSPDAGAIGKSLAMVGLSSGGGGGGGGGGGASKAREPAPGPAQAPLVIEEASVYENMGRLALLKECKARGLEVDKATAKDANRLRELLEADG